MPAASSTRESRSGRARALGGLTLVFAASVLAARPAAAEPYAAIFGGFATSEDQDVGTRLRLDGFTLVEGTLAHVRFDDAAVVGGKVGYFLERPLAGGNLGIELEVSRFSPDVSPQVVRFSGRIAGAPASLVTPVQKVRLDLTGVGVNVLYRVALLSAPNAPGGRFHVYVGVGVDVVVADFSTRTTPLDVNRDVGDTDVVPALQAMVGVKWFLTPWLAVFAEYQFLDLQRLTFLSVARGSRSGVPVTERAVDHAGFRAHLGVAGLAIHW